MSNEADKPVPPSAEPPATDVAEASTGRRSHYMNWMSFVGLFLFGAGVAASVFLFLLEMQMGNTNVYLAIVLFMVMPAVLVSGIALFMAGVWLERRRDRRQGDSYLPQIDFSRRQHRRLALIAAMVGVIFIAISIFGAYRSFEFTESTEFCGEICHEVMHPEFIAHKNSPHSRVECVECHVGPGPEHYVKSKLRGMHQVKAVMTGDFARPIQTPLGHLRPAREICVQCHWPEKFYEKVMREHVYFKTDEENSRYNMAMLINVGGGDVEKMGASGAATGIHWHMVLANQIDYIATDRQKQEIPYVRAVDREGNETVYLAEGTELSAEQLVSQYTPERMDCIDCHNRSVHQFTNPQRILNTALLLDRISPGIPHIKLKGMEVLADESYASQEQAVGQIEARLLSYYRDEYPEYLAANEPKVRAAIAELQRMYRQNFFPTMKADWRAHPDNIGHTFSKGCFRCHDGKHQSRDGKTITNDCNICHSFVGQSTGKTIPELTGAQTYVHPEEMVDVEGAVCTECHQGKGAPLPEFDF